MNTWWMEGFLLGVSSGVYCIGSCAPVYLPLMLQNAARGFRHSVTVVAELLLGRLAAYLLFGGLIGAAGNLFQGPGHTRILALATSLCGALMIASLRAEPWKERCGVGLLCYLPSGRTIPFAVGFLTGINLCPPFLAAMSRGMELGSAWRGVLYFGALFLGTSGWVILPALALPAVASERMARIGRLTCGLVGGWLVLEGLAGLAGWRWR